MNPRYLRHALFTLGALAALGAFIPMNSRAEAGEVDQKPAIAAAQSWLGLVDRGDYRASWKDAAALFKGAVTEEQWSAAARAARAPLGKLISRKLKSATSATHLPGAPDGQYLVLQYDAVFENRASAVETITPMLEKDGSWRVSGYFIK